MVENADLHCDIFGNLPLEICLKILQHLPLYQLFQAQRVSRRWSEILTSRPCLDYHLRTCHQDDEITTGALEPSVASAMAEHIDAYRRGSPFSRMVINLLGEARDPEFGQYYTKLHGDKRDHYYADGIVAWLNEADSDDGVIEYFYVATGQQGILRAPDPDVEKIAVSSSTLVAMTDSGKNYIWSLPATPLSEPTMVQVNVDITNTTVAVAGQTVATLILGSLARTSDTIGATIFRLDTEITTCFDMYILGDKREVLLDYDGQSIFVFQHNHQFQDHLEEEGGF